MNPMQTVLTRILSFARSFESAFVSAIPAALAKAAGYLESARTSLPGVNDDPYSLAIAAVETYERLGTPEGELALAQAVLHVHRIRRSD